MAQRTSGQAGSLQSPAYQNRNARKNQALSKAALVGIIFWVLFMFLSMLMSIRGR